MEGENNEIINKSFGRKLISKPENATTVSEREKSNFLNKKKKVF